MPSTLPINLFDLLRQRTVVGARIEYKAGWNPDAVIRRIGEFLKELDLTEGRATGIPKILRAMHSNGSPTPEIVSDEDRRAFMIRLPIHPEAENEDLTPHVTPHVADLLKVCTKEHSRDELLDLLQLSDRKHFTVFYLRPALYAGLVEMTDPAHPRSTQQRYRLTNLGRNLGAQKGPSRDQVETLHFCAQAQTLADLMKHCGRTNHSKFRNQVLRPLLEQGLIEMTLPDKPQSSRQRYRVTSKGQKNL